MKLHRAKRYTLWKTDALFLCRSNWIMYFQMMSRVLCWATESWLFFSEPDWLYDYCCSYLIAKTKSFPQSVTWKFRQFFFYSLSFFLKSLNLRAVKLTLFRTPWSALKVAVNSKYGYRLIQKVTILIVIKTGANLSH